MNFISFVIVSKNLKIIHKENKLNTFLENSNYLIFLNIIHKIILSKKKAKTSKMNNFYGKDN
jgi:hypothetical protein